MVENANMRALDPDSAASIAAHVRRQAQVEELLLEAYVPSHKTAVRNFAKELRIKRKALEDNKLTRSAREKIDEALDILIDNPPLSHYPPNFVPISIIFPPGIKGGSTHEFIEMREYVGHERVAGRDKHMINGSSKINGATQVNKVADLKRAGLIDVREDSKFKEAVAEKFNSSFADNGDMSQLVTILQGLNSATFEIQDFRDPDGKVSADDLEAMGVMPFTGQVTVEHDLESQTILIENSLVGFAGPIAGEGAYPTFELMCGFLDENGELPAGKMLEFRKQLSESLGLDLSNSLEEISAFWSNQLHVSYNEWVRGTRSILSGNGIQSTFPKFNDLDGSDANRTIEICSSGQAPNGVMK